VALAARRKKLQLRLADSKQTELCTYVDAFMQNVNWDEVNRRVGEIPIRK